MNEINIKKGYQNILEKYSQYRPYEMCALLIGTGRQVHNIYFTNNIEQSPVHFTITDEELMKGYKKAVEMDMEVIGIFHSHPNNKAWPSVTDERFMKTNPGVWIIYSGTEKNMKAFVLDKNEKPEEVRMVNI